MSRVIGVVTTLTRGSGTARPRRSGVVAIHHLPPEEPAREPLHARVARPRSGARLRSELLGEADALMRDRLPHRGALRDLVHEQPEVLALEQPRHGLVDEPALDHPGHEPLRLRAVEHAVAEPR